MIHMTEVAYASPVLRKLFTSERTIEEDAQMLALLDGVPANHRFVDQYGPECVLAQVGLSWWRDVVPRLNEDFILTPEECNEVSKMVIDNMPPSPSKVIQAIGEGTELAHCVEQYPNSNIIRDPSMPYEVEEQSVLCFLLGQLVGFLCNGSKGEGILVSP